MINNKIVVGITQGDSNGIGYEVIIKSLADARILEQFVPVIYGSSKLFGFYRKYIHNIEPPDTHLIGSAKEAGLRKVNILNCLPANVHVEPGQPTAEGARSAIQSIECAVNDLRHGIIDVLVTAPINKRTISNEGFGFAGHTEYLQKEFGDGNEVLMLMISERLKVAVVTGHIPLKDVATSISEEKILGKLRLLKSSLQRDFGVEAPRIGVLGLNPHCGDGGLLGDEEQTVILPAVKRAQEEGIMAFGPYSPDGYFSLGQYNRFDATLAMYHDQGLTPFKALAFESGVNFTAGLPIVRTSPDHGTAFEKVCRDEANPHSMVSAIYAAVDIFKHRLAYDELYKGRMPEARLHDKCESSRNSFPEREKTTENDDE